MRPRLDLALIEGRFAVCRLDASELPPAPVGGFWSATRTPDEWSVVCEETSAPAGCRREMGWRMLRVAGPLDFALVGILASIARPLADAGVSLFAISTFDTDYVLVKEENLARARGVL